jgi:DNA topoisomerase-1
MTETFQAYCVKCKTKRDMVNAQAVFTETGRPGTRGACSVCGTALFRMGATTSHDNLPKPEPKPAPARKSAKKTAAKGKRRPVKGSKAEKTRQPTVVDRLANS